MANASSLPTHEPVDTILPSKTELFLELHFKKILLGVLVIILIACVWGVTSYLKHKTEREAGELFSAARTVEDYDIVIQQFADTAAAGNAQLLKARTLWQDGKKESAIKTLQEFIAKHPSHALLPEGRLALASQQAALGEPAAAQDTLNAFLKDHPDHALAPQAQIQLGDLLWAEGKIDDAKKLFENLPKSYPGKMTSFVSEVDERLRMINAGLPTTEVDPPPAPKVEEKAADTSSPLSPSLEIPPLTPSVPLPAMPPPSPTEPAAASPDVNPDPAAAPAPAASAPKPPTPPAVPDTP